MGFTSSSSRVALALSQGHMTMIDLLVYINGEPPVFATECEHGNRSPRNYNADGLVELPISRDRRDVSVTL